MRKYLSLHPEQRGPHYPEELEKLDELVQRATEALRIVDPDERNEVAAGILSLYSTGIRDDVEILEITIRRHRRDSDIRRRKA
ncbi:hypothetical protein M2281_002547 [Mesorhizobium soli]|uniref:hypothetical protein n=1 Tax=Pseudaminobacter soli (ex Li et al. 2025) TaxID=1295366 RepID=UPI002475E07C|nr:hypothetical protein [Mesorhizobium soli]MDH6231949.1 hypothetical protein [Mesorhizobium soli]